MTIVIITVFLLISGLIIGMYYIDNSTKSKSSIKKTRYTLKSDVVYDEIQATKHRVTMNKFSARSFSNVVEKEFTVCPWCGVRYTEKMIENLSSMTCESCGGAL